MVSISEVCFGGSKPPPYICVASPRPTYAWQAEHPAVHWLQFTGRLPRPTYIRKLAGHTNLPVIYYFSARSITLFPGGIFSQKRGGSNLTSRRYVSIFLFLKKPVCHESAVGLSANISTASAFSTGLPFCTNSIPCPPGRLMKNS